MKRTRLAVCMLILISIFIAPLYAQESEARQHEGFFFRFILGVGSGNTVMEEALFGDDMTFKGTSVGGRFQIGASISQNLILFGEIGGFNMAEPTVTWRGDDSELTDGNLTVNNFGAGVTYYLMPVNVFFTFSVGTCIYKIRDDEDTLGESDTGFGFYAAVGKEWWINDKWALGGGVFGYMGSAKDKGANGAPMNDTVFGILFSATLD